MSDQEIIFFDKFLLILSKFFVKYSFLNIKRYILYSILKEKI